MAGEWRNLTLDQLGRIVTGKTPSSKGEGYFEGTIPFVTPTDFDGRRIITDTGRYLTERGAKAVAGACIPSSAVMVTCIGSDMGKAAIAGRECVTNQQINSILVDDDNEPLFVYYNLSGRKAEICSHASGSAQPILNKSGFGALKIVLPPLPEQRAIAHILGTLDDKIELNRRMNETLEQMARALFKSWFVDFDPVRTKAAVRRQHPNWTDEQVSRAACPNLNPEIAALFPDSFQDSELGEIPKGWKVGRIGNIVQNYDSKRIPLSSRERAKRQGPYRYYGAAGIIDHVDDFLFDGIYVLVGEDGTVVTELGNPVVQYVWGKFWVNNHAHVLKASGSFSDEHLLLVLQQTYVVPYVTGAVQPKLSQTNMNAIPFINSRPEVNKAFSKFIEPMFAKIRTLCEEVGFLADLRDTLLPKLISGELRVPDAERITGRYV